MSENGILVALIAFMASVLVALIAVWRFRRKDRADADAVEEGTISGRFKDADTLMQYIDQRVEERTKAVTEKQVAADAEIRKLEQQFAEITEAVRLVISQQWIWDQRGRPGGLPMLPDPILHRLGLGYIAEGWTTDPTPDSPGSSS